MAARPASNGSADVGSVGISGSVIVTIVTPTRDVAAGTQPLSVQNVVSVGCDRPSSIEA